MNSIPKSVADRLAQLKAAGILDDSAVRDAFVQASGNLLKPQEGGTLAQHGPPGEWTGAVPDTGNLQHAENRNHGPEGFQSRPGGEQERGKLTQMAKEPAPNSRPAERGISGPQSPPPMDRNVPGTAGMSPNRNGTPPGRAYRAAPRKSVYLTSLK